MVREFDQTKHCLGTLCNRGHDWDGTGQSLRSFKSSGKPGGCLACTALKAKQRYHANPEKAKAIGKKWRESEHGKAYMTQKRQTEEYKARMREYWQRPEYKARRKAYNDVYTKTETARENRRKYKRTEKGKASEARYRRSEAGIAARKRQEEKAKTDPAKIERRRLNYQRRKEQGRLREAALKYSRSERGRALILKNTRKRRARKQLLHTVDIAPIELQAHFAKFGCGCAYCGSEERISVDHFIPQSQGGSDCLGNYVPACLTCNVSKNNRDPYTWYERQPFFSKQRWNNILKVLGKTQKTYNQIPLL